MAKLFGKIPLPSGPAEGEPRLHFWRLKKQLGKPPVAWEHVVIPFEAQSRDLQKQTARIRLERNYQKIPFALSPALLASPSQIPGIGGAVWGGTMFLNYRANFKAHKQIKSALSTGVEKESLPFSAAFEPTEGGYKRMTPARLMQKLPKMTHFVVDNDGSIVALRHPLDGVAKAQGFGERAKNLGIWLKWIPLRTRMRLRKPRRVVRVKVPLTQRLKRLVRVPVPQQLKPVPVKILRATRR
ncbi:MAG: hypothetical protein WC792_05905 [Candidatus Micrarchaeia archaeon]